MLIFEAGPRTQGWAEAEVGFQETELRGGRLGIGSVQVQAAKVV